MGSIVCQVTWKWQLAMTQDDVQRGIKQKIGTGRSRNAVWNSPKMSHLKYTYPRINFSLKVFCAIFKSKSGFFAEKIQIRSFSKNSFFGVKIQSIAAVLSGLPILEIGHQVLHLIRIYTKKESLKIFFRFIRNASRPLNSRVHACLIWIFDQGKRLFSDGLF